MCTRCAELTRVAIVRRCALRPCAMKKTSGTICRPCARFAASHPLDSVGTHRSRLVLVPARAARGSRFRAARRPAVAIAVVGKRVVLHAPKLWPCVARREPQERVTRPERGGAVESHELRSPSTAEMTETVALRARRRASRASLAGGGAPRTTRSRSTTRCARSSPRAAARLRRHGADGPHRTRPPRASYVTGAIIGVDAGRTAT